MDENKKRKYNIIHSRRTALLLKSAIDASRYISEDIQFQMLEQMYENVRDLDVQFDKKGLTDFLQHIQYVLQDYCDKKE